jgi:hypothetical protein
MSCLSELELELHLLAPADADAHVAGCERCKGRLAEMKVQGEEFARLVHPATADALAARRRGALRWQWASWLALPCAAAAAALIASLSLGPPAGYLGSKGPAVALTVYAQSNGLARALHDGAQVQAGAALRFRVQPDHSCHLWIVSVDQTGLVSQLYPAAGDLSAEKSAGGALPGGALLDGRPGPERMFAICSEEPISFTELSRAIERSVPVGATGVRSARELGALPGAGQASILLEKAP